MLHRTLDSINATVSVLPKRVTQHATRRYSTMQHARYQAISYNQAIFYDDSGYQASNTSLFQAGYSARYQVVFYDATGFEPKTVAQCATPHATKRYSTMQQAARNPSRFRDGSTSRYSARY